MLKHQIIIDITPESAKKFASLSVEKQEQLKLLLKLKLQDLISSHNIAKDSPISNSIQNAQNRDLTEEMLDCISEGNLENKHTNELSRKIIEKWHYLRDNHQELDPNNPLSNDEIEIIRQILIQHNQTRPIGVATGELIIPDTFDCPLPDEILDLFYSP